MGVRAQASSRLNKRAKSSDPPTLHPYALRAHTLTPWLARLPPPLPPPTHSTNREGQPGPGGVRWLSRPWGS